MPDAPTQIQAPPEKATIVAKPSEPVGNAFLNAVKSSMASPDPASAESKQPEKKSAPESQPEAKKADPSAQSAAEDAERAQRARDAKGRFASAADEPQTGDTPAEPKPAEPENIRTLRQKYEAAVKELAEYKTRAVPQFEPEDVAKLKAELEEREKVIAKVKYEHSKEYQEKYIKPWNKIVDKAKAILPADQHAKIEYLFDMPHSDARLEAIERIMEAASPGRQAEVLRLASEAASIVDERSEAIGDPKARLQELEAQENARKASEQKQRAAFAQNLFNDTLKEASAAFEMFRTKEGDEEHNRAVQSRIKAAQDFMLGSPDAGTIAEYTFYAVAGKEAIPMLRKAQSEIQKLTAELEKIRSLKPGSVGAASTSDSERPKSFVDGVMRSMKGG